MSTINPNLSILKPIKVEVDHFQSMKLEMEMKNLVREREWLKKEVDLLAKTQSYTELEKCSAEEKLERSERRCEELDQMMVQMKEKLERSERQCEELRHVKEKLNRSRRTCEDLRRKEIETTEAVDELRVKKMESEKAARLYFDDLEPRVLKMEATLAKLLSLDKYAAAATDAEEEEKLNMPHFAKNGKLQADGNEGIGLSKKGGRNTVYSGPNLRSGSIPAYISKGGQSKGSLQDYEDKNPEVRGASNQMRLDCRCTLRTIHVIKDNLQKENLELFGKYCFGDLLKINEFKFQGQLILKLLMHMDMNASNEQKLIFKINNSNLEFGPSEFFRITGLRFGNLETTITTSSSSIIKNVFQDRPFITMKKIEEAFLKISSCRKGKGEVTLKLALLYFLYETLLTNRCENLIDEQYLYLIEDLEKFNAFPWGQVSFHVLVSSILRVRLRMDGSEVTHQVTRFDIHGFCYAFQAWAYEVMPSVAAYCASRVNNSENITPWILRWSATRTLYSKELKKYFPPCDKAHLNNTMGKWEDLPTNDIPHVAINKGIQKKRKLPCDHDQMPHAQPSSAITPSTPPPPSTNASTYSYHHLARRLSRVEGILEALLKKIDQPTLDISDDDDDDLPRNGFPRVDDEEDVSSATQIRHGTSGPNPVSMNRATNKHAKLERSYAETEQARVLSEPANGRDALGGQKVYVRCRFKGVSV